MAAPTRRIASHLCPVHLSARIARERARAPHVRGILLALAARRPRLAVVVGVGAARPCGRLARARRPRGAPSRRDARVPLWVVPCRTARSEWASERVRGRAVKARTSCMHMDPRWAQARGLAGGGQGQVRVCASERAPLVCSPGLADISTGWPRADRRGWGGDDRHHSQIH